MSDWQAPDETFVTRSGDRLYQNGADFRFSGTNIYWLGAIFTEAAAWSANTQVYQPSHYRVDDALETAKLMGCNVVRSISLGWSVGYPGALLPVLGGAYNEDAFLAMDYAIYKAGQLGIFLIIPLLDDYDYYWGNKTFFGATPYDATWTTAHRAYVSQILNRVNTYNGLAYKDDPAIMTWQAGNELSAGDTWTDDFAAYVKSIDHKHLFMDSRKQAATITAARLNPGSRIDIVSCHYWATDALSTNLATSGLSNKVMVVDEYDWGEAFREFDLATWLASLEAAAAVRGDCWWNLASHADTNGFAYDANNYVGQNITHSNAPLDMLYGASNIDARVLLLRNHAYAMRGISAPSYPICAAPVLSLSGSDLVWRGVAGAKTYTMERSTNGTDYTEVVTGLSDGYSTSNQGTVTNNGGTWTDPDPQPHAWYRISGVNDDGIAGAVSNVVEIE